MSDPVRFRYAQKVPPNASLFDSLFVRGVLLIGALYMGWQAMQGDWFELALALLGEIILFTLAFSPRFQQRVLGVAINRRHATYIVLYWGYSAVWLNVIRLLQLADPSGKDSGTFYALALLALALTWMIVRTFIMLSPIGYRIFFTRIPLWEQILVAANEAIAAGLLAVYVGGSVVNRLLQPDVFSIRVDPIYTAALTSLLLIYYLAMQLMWLQSWNDWLSQPKVFQTLARLTAPLALLSITLVIARRLFERADPRTANLLGDAQFDLAVLSIGAVVWLVVMVLTWLVYTSSRGVRERFLPESLLKRLPGPLASGLRALSDLDVMLLLALLSTLIPAYLFLLGDSGGIIGALRAQILQGASALLFTSEQALALLFALPFYVLILALLALYGYVFSLPTLSAQDRDDLVARLPVGFLIVLIITLYLFAVPFSQVLIEGRLPRLPQDLGSILAFNVLIPLILLYVHYYLFVRLPYGRGQTTWRERESGHLARRLVETDQQIHALNGELGDIDQAWQANPTTPDPAAGLQGLYRYVQLNSLRDDLNMQRLQILAARQQLTEISETPVSVAVARLPFRVVSLGIPLLILIQVYQWAILNNGLREIINTPNLTVDQFFRIILRQLNF